MSSFAAEIVVVVRCVTAKGRGTIGDWSAEAMNGGSVIPDLPDPARMRREIDRLVLLGSSSVVYATGAAMPAQDCDRVALFRDVG